MLIIVCLLDSLAPIFVKWSEQEISAFSTVFYRFLFGFFIFSLINTNTFVKYRAANEKSDSDVIVPVFTQVILLFLAAGIFAACNQFFWAVSLTQTSIGNSALLHSLAPLFTVLFGWFFVGKKFDSQLLLRMIIAIGGSILLTVGDLQISITKMQGDGFAFLSAFFSAAYMSIVEQLRMQFNASMILFWRCLLGTIFISPFLLFKSDRIIPVSASGWLAILGLTLIFAISHCLLAYSLALVSSTLVTIVLLLDPFLSSIQAWIFFSEKLNVLDYVSFGIVILGIYLSISSDIKEIHE